VAGHEHRAALRGQRLQQVADPADPLGIEPVHRLVQQQHRRISQQRRGDPQALPHPEGELPRPPLGRAGQADHVEHLVDPGPRNRAAGGQRGQVTAGAPVTLPARTSKLSASTATVGPYRFVRSLASII
jgi:hypothetical protein